MSRIGIGIPSNQSKIYPVAPASLILSPKYIFLPPCPKTHAREKARLFFGGICSAAFVREIKRDLLMAAIDPCLIQLCENLCAIETLICMAAHLTNRRSP